VDCILLASNQPEKSIGEIFNICDPNSPNWIDYYNKIADGIDRQRPWLSLPFWIVYILCLFFEFFYR
jgi:hypothetical protein